VFTEFRNRYYSLGCFKVSINIVRKQLNVHRVSRTDDEFIYVDGDVVSDWEHPHLNAGVPCLGNIDISISEMLNKGELYGLFFTMHQFLRTYNDRSPYRHIIISEGAADGTNRVTQWKEVTKDEADRLYKSSIERTAKLLGLAGTGEAAQVVDNSPDQGLGVGKVESV
jgi:hypothetical protein